LVEDFPLPPPTLAETEEHNEYLRQCLKSGKLADGSKLDETRRRFFEHELKTFKKSEYPEKIPTVGDGYVESGRAKMGSVNPKFSGRI
jgi:hypothetical protein